MSLGGVGGDDGGSDVEECSEWTGEEIGVGGDIFGTHYGRGVGVRGGGSGGVDGWDLGGGGTCDCLQDEYGVFFPFPPIFARREFQYFSSWAKCTLV